MSVRSEFYHSVVFGEKNTWDDWHLVPSSRPVINPPDVIKEHLNSEEHIKALSSQDK